MFIGNLHIEAYIVKGLKGHIMTFQESRKTKNMIKIGRNFFDF
jgi:hypothetical protein